MELPIIYMSDTDWNEFRKQMDPTLLDTWRRHQKVSHTDWNEFRKQMDPTLLEAWRRHQKKLLIKSLKETISPNTSTFKY